MTDPQLALPISDPAPDPGARPVLVPDAVLPPAWRDPHSGLTAAEVWESARGADRDVAIARRAVLDQWETFRAQRDPQGDVRHDTVSAFAAAYSLLHPETPLSTSTLYRWRAAACDRGLIGLLPQYAVGRCGAQIPDDIRDRFHRAYLSPRQLSVAVARDIVRGELALTGDARADALPSVATFRRYVRTLPVATVTLARQGDDAYHRDCEPYLERDYADIAVMGVWVSDHMQFDHFRWHRGRWIRPWVTVWMDVRSRLRVGWCVCEAPSQDTTLSALAMAILRYGIPDVLYSDNGREYAAQSFVTASRRFRVRLDEPRVRALTEHLGVRWQWSIPENPRSRGMIERAFGVDHDRFDRLQPTYCGRDPQHRPPDLTAELKAAAASGRVADRALPTLEQLHADYRAYVDGVANQAPHDGDAMDGRSPMAVFRGAEYIKRTATVDELRLLLMRSSKPVRVTQNGIWAFEAWYRSDPLALRQGEQLYYRYDLENIGELHVFDLADRFVCTVQRRDRVGGTAADHRRIGAERKRQKRLVRAYLETRQQIADAPDPLAATIAARKAETTATGIGRQTVVRPIHTPFKAAAKAIGDGQKARLSRDALGREARKISKELFGTRPETAPAEPAAPDLATEASAKIRQLFRRTSS